MHVTIVHIRVNQEHIDNFIEATLLNHQASIKEKGIRRFDILQDANDPTKFMLYEAYATASDAAAHKDTLHYVMWHERVAMMTLTPFDDIRYNCLFPDD
jgi:autoinducer 2-degrading protein